MDKQLEKQLGTLEGLLQDLMQAHVHLLELLEEKRSAMKHAKHDEMAQVCQRENEQIRKISDMENSVCNSSPI